MQKFIATVNEQKANAFRAYCKRLGVSPYSVLVAHINSLIGNQDTKVIGNQDTKVIGNQDTKVIGNQDTKVSNLAHETSGTHTPEQIDDLAGTAVEKPTPIPTEERYIALEQLSVLADRVGAFKFDKMGNLRTEKERVDLIWDHLQRSDYEFTKKLIEINGDKR